VADTINLNGEIVAPGEARVSALDHGFLFGDSVYETLRTHRGVPMFFEKHLERIHASASGLGLEIPWGMERLREEVRRTLEASGEQEAVARLVVTRGVGPVELDPSRCLNPAVVVYVFPFPEYPREHYERGCPIAIVEVRRSPRASLDPGLKTGNRLNNILALVEARRAGAFEAVMMNERGMVAEGTTTNVFARVEDTLITPPATAGILPGITRSAVIELTRGAGIALEERELLPQELRAAREAFLTATTKGVMPIGSVDGETLGEGIGPMTRLLMELYAMRLEEEAHAGRC
jgi:branched-chain amino acid aminotransferase